VTSSCEVSVSRQYGRADVDYSIWYSDWMKRLAKQHTRAELERMAGITTAVSRKAAGQHLRAIEATHSMGGQSQRRAHARNVVAASGDTKIAISGALEIYDLFPEHTKEAA
jgi:hypothetical protein